jgi:hypothetical protein
MREEHINDGDIVVFHPGITEGNGIYVVSISNSLVVKRVDFTPQTITLISASPAYEPRRISGPELSSISISGRVWEGAASPTSPCLAAGRGKTTKPSRRQWKLWALRRDAASPAQAGSWLSAPIPGTPAVFPLYPLRFAVRCRLPQKNKNV